MAGINYPVHAIREQVSSALHILVHIDRLTGGSRKLITIAEITGMESQTICLHDLFSFNQTGVDEDGNATGHFEVCGVRPRLLDKLKAEGIELPAGFFQRRILGEPAARSK
jgi:pilus assembly protein CpaF